MNWLWSILDLYMCTYIVHLLVQCPLYWSSQFSLGDHGDEIFSPERKIRKQWKSVTDDEFCNWIYKTICKKFIRFVVHAWMSNVRCNKQHKLVTFHWPARLWGGGFLCCPWHGLFVHLLTRWQINCLNI